MTESIWLLAGLFLGIWINYNDADHYKKIAKLQSIYIDLLSRALDRKNWLEE